MKRRGLIILVVFCCISILHGQEKPVVLSTSQFQSYQRLFLAPLDGWIYKAGDDKKWAEPGIDVSDWEKLKPTELSASMEDSVGRLEGWFRLAFTLDSSFENMPLYLSRNLWAATDIYLDGVLIHSFGKTGNPYEAYNPILKEPIPIRLQPNKEYLLAMHLVAYETTFTQREIRFKPENLQNFINLNGPRYLDRIENDLRQTHIYGALCMGISFLLFFLF
ncbi:hypothetical protein [Portibacter marinus]|uniref:hypothetical protein n=1 Tax=Portibacter marinus TaxID=2898660 RepID=UPI001F3F5869|nr:hypothetical protein [Portibacter marinus]